MELKEFIKNVLRDLVEGVDEVSNTSSREIKLYSSRETGRSVEFDIAVTVENNSNAKGGAGIKIFQIVEGGGEVSSETKNSSVSRIKFGVDIHTQTKLEIEEGRRNYQNIEQTSFK